MSNDSLFEQISAGVGSTTSPADLKEAQAEQKELFPKDHERKEGLKQTLHWAVIWGLRVAALMVIGVLIVRTWHLIAPENLMWLTNDKLQKIDNLLFSGTLGALLSRYLNQAIPDRS